MKTVAAIRLVFATALIFLFSGTMAFAHEGHVHGAQHEQTARSSVSAVPAKSSALPATQLSKPNFAVLHTEVVVTVISASSPASDCGHGCCCCGGGASTCGMSGCSALGLSAAETLVPRPVKSGRLTISIADILSGRSDSGLDRPPKA